MIRTAGLVTLLLLSVHSSALTQRDSSELGALFDAYIDAWNASDFRRIATEFYAPPVYVFGAEKTVSVPGAEELVALLSTIRDELDNAGFGYSKIRQLDLCDLGGNLVLASLQFNRYDRNGQLMGGTVLSAAYLARKTSAGWRMVAHIEQGIPVTLRCSIAEGAQKDS